MPSCCLSARATGRRGFTALLIGVGCSLAAGCAHHRADQYSYAPPYAPPVYPQPAAAMAPPTVVMPSAPAVAGIPPTAMAAGVPQAPAAGGVVTAVGGECPPFAGGTEGVVVTSGAIVDGGQTPPCPPGP